MCPARSGIQQGEQGIDTTVGIEEAARLSAAGVHTSRLAKDTAQVTKACRKAVGQHSLEPQETRYATQYGPSAMQALVLMSQQWGLPFPRTHYTQQVFAPPSPGCWTR